jgi:benzoyl-CoA reductase subunit B
MDPTKPLESLAANGMALHANHNLDWLVDNISNLCQEYKIDGLVCHAHRTCRPLAAPQLEIMDGVSRRLGIPAVFFEADMADETFYADAQVDTRVQALLEEIDARRKGR